MTLNQNHSAQCSLAQKVKAVFVFFLLSALSACASNPESSDDQTKTYLLDTNSNETEFNNSATLLALAPVVLPEYLDQPGLVMLETDHRISVAQYHSWAEPLSVSARRSLLSELSRNSSNYAFVANCDDCRVVSVQIDRFYPTANGQALLSGSFKVQHNGQQQVPLSRQLFSLSVTLEKNGYEHAVAKMRELLAQLASKINSSLVNTE